MSEESAIRLPPPSGGNPPAPSVGGQSAIHSSHIHVIAVGGVAMATFAAMLKERGYRVTGSDQGVYPPMSDFLARAGIEVIQGYRPENLIPAPDLVIVGNAVSRLSLIHI